MQHVLTADEIALRIRVCQTEINHTLRVRDDDEYYEANVKRYEEMAAQLLKQAEDLKRRRKDAEQIIAEQTTKINQLKRERKLAIHRSKLERMLRLQEKIDALQSTDVQSQETLPPNLRSRKARRSSTKGLRKT